MRGEKPASGIDPTAASRSYWERELIAPGSKHSGHYFCVTQCAGKWGGPCCTHCVCAVCQLGSKGERQGRLPIDSPIISKLHIVMIILVIFMLMLFYSVLYDPKVKKTTNKPSRFGFLGLKYQFLLLCARCGSNYLNLLQFSIHSGFMQPLFGASPSPRKG